jgi:hypothetical protein
VRFRLERLRKAFAEVDEDVFLADHSGAVLESERGAAANVLAEREDALVGDRVVGVVADLPPSDDPRLQQHTEVLGNVLLRRIDAFAQLLHTRLPLPEQVEQLDSRRVGEHAEAARDQLDQVIGKGVLNHRLASLLLSHGSSPDAARATSAGPRIRPADNYSTA